MRVITRVDVSAAIGTGHWRRMQNLLSAIPNAAPIFAVRTDDPSNSLFRGSVVFLIPEGDDIKPVTELCERESAQLLLVDLLKYPQGYVKRLKGTSNRRIVTFHEYRDWSPDSDLAVNYNTFDGFDQITEGYALTGPQYCILNQNLKPSSSGSRGNGVLALFGGSDPSRFAERFIEQVVFPTPEIQFLMHFGPFGPRINNPNIAQLQFTTPNDSIFDLMASCRVAVTAAGNSMYEFMYLGKAPLVVAHNVHQTEFARNAAARGYCRFFGTSNQVDWAALRSAVKTTHSSLAIIDRPPLDGLGTRRIASRISQLLA